MDNNLLLLAILSLLFNACVVQPKAIHYGSDQCHFCRMTIVDQQHAAQIVNDKGKAFNFDAVECMLNHLRSTEYSQRSLYLVNVYENPGILKDATSVTYLISEGIPSPMGEYLTGFQNYANALEVKNELGGAIYEWEDLPETIIVK